MKPIGIAIFLIGIFMMTCPQALLGLDSLKWMYRLAFPGEAFLGALVSSFAFLLIYKVPQAGKGK